MLGIYFKNLVPIADGCFFVVVQQIVISEISVALYEAGFVGIVFFCSRFD